MVSNKDILIISNLRKNGRESITKISKLTKIPISTIFDRLRLREDDLIKKYSLFLDYSKLGFNFRTEIMLKVNGREKEKVREYLKNQGNVNSVFAVDNGFDFMVEGIFKDRFDMDDFLMDLEGNFDIIKKDCHQVLEEIKHEDFLTKPEDVAGY